MPNPMRLTAGFTQHAKFQPFQALGIPDPNFYLVHSDDFPYWDAAHNLVNATGNGAVASVDGAGGVVTLTTNSSTPATTDIAAVRTHSACFTYTGGMKTAFACRMSLTDALNTALNVGMIQNTATPFTVTDGIYMQKASGSTSLVAYVVVGSVVKASIAIPGFTMANSTMYDLAIVYEGRDDVLFYAGQNLFGAAPDQNREQLGPIARISGVYSGGMLTTALLNQVVAIQSGTASSKVATLDFYIAAGER